MIPTTPGSEDQVLMTPSPTLWDGPVALRPRLPPTEAEIVVVGAGITGLTTALLLARAGRDVVVLEATTVGALASGRNTGKVSVLQGTKLSQLLGSHSERVVRAYVEGNLEGAAWLRRFCDHQGVRFQTQDAVTYASTADDVPLVAQELAAARRVGLPVTWRASMDVPFELHGAVALADQFQVDPRAVTLALADELEHHGGRIGEGQRVVHVSWGRRPRVRTDDGAEFRCENLVLATGTPILDRGLYFAKLEARRSYLLAFTGAEQPPGMLISAGSPVRSLRGVPGTEPTLLVGGGGHVVGRGEQELQYVEELRSWVAQTYPGALETHAWSAQDYASHDGIPYVGHLPRGMGCIWVASGYDKWGLSNGTSAGLRIAGSILGSPPAWGRPLERRISGPRAAWEIVRRNVEVGALMASRWTKAESRTVSAELPTRTGEVGHLSGDPRPVGVVGSRCAVRAVCTHLGGTLRWNDAEQSWDCPLHGSRFTPDGAVIEGPAVRPLERVEE